MQKYNAGALVVYHGKSAQVSAVSADKIEIRIEGGASKSGRRTLSFYIRSPSPLCLRAHCRNRTAARSWS